MVEQKRRLGEILIEAGVLSAEQLEQVLVIQKNRQLRLGTILLQEGFVTEPQLIQALSRRLSIPWVSLWHIDISEELLSLVAATLAEEFFLVPIYIRTSRVGERTLYVAMNDPTDDAALRLVSASSGMSVKPMIAGPSDIASAIRYYYYGEEEIEEEEPQNGPPPFMQTETKGSSPQPPPSPKVAGVAAPPTTPLTPETSEQTVETTASPKRPSQIEEYFQGDPVDLEAIEEEAIEEEESKEPSSGDTDSKSDQISAKGEHPSEEVELDENKKKEIQRQVEKHMYGVGRNKPASSLSLTLLDGTTIAFGGKARKRSPGTFSKEDLVAGLRAAAVDTPIDDFLPSIRWEAHMAALLEILFRKHLVFFEEYMDELNKTS